MSTTNTYLIPDKAYKVGQFQKQVKKVLTQLEIIDGYYDQEDGLLAAGENGELIGSTFEYCSIHDTKYKRLLPEATTSGYGSTCSSCKSDMDAVFYEALNDFYDEEDEQEQEADMLTLQVKCPTCQYINLLSELTFTTETLIANQFFQFVDLDEELNQNTVKEIEQRLGCSLRIIYERM